MPTCCCYLAAQFGWQMLFYPEENQLWLNVPNTVEKTQFAMNTITKNWCNYTVWNATCFELFNDQPYFGGNGYVGRAWYTQSDNA